MSCRADPMTASGQLSRPPPGSYLAAPGQSPVSAVNPGGRPWSVILESDGYIKYRDRSYWVRERERDNDLRSTGAIVIHVSWEIAMDLDKFAHTLLGAFPPHVLRTLRPHSELRRHWRR